MNKTKIMILGASGKLGVSLTNIILSESDFNLILLSSNPNLSLKSKSIKLYNCNILDFKKVKKISYDEKPDYIVNCSAITDPIYSEKNKKICNDINVMSYDNILSISRVLDCNIIMPSCDCIFDGKYGPYDEDKHPSPINFLGKSKHTAENNCRAGSINLSIVRTSMLYGISTYNKNCLINDTIDLLKKGKKVYLSDEYFRTPTFVDDVSRVILRIIEKKRKGIYNASSKDMISHFEIGNIIADIFGVNKDLVVKIPSGKSEHFNLLPKITGLISLKSETDLGIKFSTLQEGLSLLKYHYNTNIEGYSKLRLESK